MNVTNKPPVAKCKDPITVPVDPEDCQARGNADTDNIDYGSHDEEDGTPMISQDKSGPFDLGACYHDDLKFVSILFSFCFGPLTLHFLSGENIVVLTATDQCGANDTCETTVNVTNTESFPTCFTDPFDLLRQLISNIDAYLDSLQPDDVIFDLPEVKGMLEATVNQLQVGIWPLFN